MRTAGNKKRAIDLIYKSIGPIFYILLVVFLVIYIKSLDWTELQDANFAWWYILIASVFGLGFRYWGVVVWLSLLNSLGARDLRKNFVELALVYAKSWLGRYIPGTAPWILGKIYFASKLGVSKNKLAVSSLLEGGLQIIVTLLIAVLILLLDPRTTAGIDPIFRLLMIGVLIVGLLTVLPPVFNRLFSFAYRLIKKKVFSKEHQVTSGTVAKGAVLYVLGALLGGLSFFFVAKAVYPEIGYNDLWFIIGASNLASAVSMLAVFAPSGIGVREAIQVALLSIIMPVELAILIAVLTRVWSIGVDFGFFGVALLVKKISDRSRPVSP